MTGKNVLVIWEDWTGECPDAAVAVREDGVVVLWLRRTPLAERLLVERGEDGDPDR